MQWYKLPKKSEYLPHMQIYLQILSTICYPVSRDQFVDLCPALSKFAHGLDFLKGKFILSGLCAVRVGRGVNPEGICLTIVKPTRVDHWPQTGVSLSLEAPLQLDQLAKVHESKFEMVSHIILSSGWHSWQQLGWIANILFPPFPFTAIHGKHLSGWTELAFYLRPTRICNIS